MMVDDSSCKKPDSLTPFVAVIWSGRRDLKPIALVLYDIDIGNWNQLFKQLKMS